MKLKQAIALSEIAELVNCHFIGKPEHLISGLNEIHVVVPGDIVFVDHPKYYDKALQSEATTILIDKVVPCPEGKALIISDDPFASYNFLTEHFSPKQEWPVAVQSENKHISTQIAPTASIGKNVTIGFNVTIMPGVVIGDNCIIGDNVIIHANTVLGADAFYFQKKNNTLRKMHSCGRVILEDDVEIGALCTLDRGVSGDTIIKKGTKLDNQVHIGHDTVIGENCLIAAQTAVAGCVTVKNNVTIWGQVGIAANVVISEDIIVAAQSGVSKSLTGHKMYMGTPAGEGKQKMRELAALRRLPQIIEEINNL
ncbi:MAG: UDP-3-O-[3-hydroxymyristoyl] glucosamine N-acyltransferase [Flavobacteriales bacterium]|jgi:UDP-3-O-[3-hydroxymyristoyl] glucosamine N-acyltransferase